MEEKSWFDHPIFDIYFDTFCLISDTSEVGLYTFCPIDVSSSFFLVSHLQEHWMLGSNSKPAFGLVYFFKIYELFLQDS